MDPDIPLSRHASLRPGDHHTPRAPIAHRTLGVRLDDVCAIRRVTAALRIYIDAIPQTYTTDARHVASHPAVRALQHHEGYQMNKMALKARESPLLEKILIWYLYLPFATGEQVIRAATSLARTAVPITMQPGWRGYVKAEQIWMDSIGRGTWPMPNWSVLKGKDLMPR